MTMKNPTSGTIGSDDLKIFMYDSSNIIKGKATPYENSTVN
jgi:hypothetical protein